MSADFFIHGGEQFFRDERTDLVVPALGREPLVLVIGSLIDRAAAVEFAQEMDGDVQPNEAMVCVPLSVFDAAVRQRAQEKSGRRIILPGE